MHINPHLASRRTILVNVIAPELDKKIAEKNFEELSSLVRTYGGIVILKILQKRGRPSARTFLGSGKVEEVKKIAIEKKADLIVINDFLKPNQSNNLRKIFGNIEVWDCFELILKIFEKHAASEEAKLQIELARLKYEFPKLYNKGKSLSQQAGHLGIRGGAGEKLLEVKRRHLRNQLKNIEDKLKKIRAVHAGQRDRRLRRGYKLAALVGYTNCGKSTIFKALTKKEHVYIADRPFATLGTQIGQLQPFGETTSDTNHQFSEKILISDTIGFIKNLPPVLFSSFLATLEETKNADLILHVIDSSDPEIENKFQTVNEILKELGCSQKPTLYIFNKIDLLKEKISPHKWRELASPSSTAHVSALQKNDIEKIKKLILEKTGDHTLFSLEERFNKNFRFF